MCLLAPFIVQNFKKNSSSGSRVMKMRNFCAQNGPFPQMGIFFPEILLMNIVSFIDAYLDAKKKIQISIY